LHVNCPRCGAPPLPDQRACPYCGTAWPAPGAGAPRPSPPRSDEDPEILALIDADNLIGAIKRYRDLTKLGLKESKEAVDDIVRRRRQR